LLIWAFSERSSIRRGPAAELLALRSLFFNLHFRTGKASLTEAEMRR
jgi:hypothetical protein